ncbi:hypothetical protein BDW02DRAFT_602640 [Decorospora gaudefroyi]|uniref:Uncharacterized protein n=1 Tax=Decorospora gaudefroyi TaxID=184978 RepID=A0A6A5JX49_9PLEO|nr:hypothetical protein BDW02DRAFT_602640 [Decorospora gaudefroyi]
MGSVKISSELMTQHVAAVPVPHSSQFFTVRDENGAPLLFSLGSNGVLFALKENQSGFRVRLDLNAAFGIYGKKVVTFSVVQETPTENLYLGFAYKNSNDGDETTLIMCRPFHPMTLNTEEPFSLEFYMMRGTESPKSNIARILIGPKHPRQLYPAALISYVPIEDAHSSADLARISVDSLQSEWRFHNDVELPENATELVDVCPASLPVGTGYFVLYVIQGQTQLVFIGTPTASGFSFKVSLKAPSGARRLATVQQPNGYSGLVCGGNGLHFWTPTDAQKRDSPGYPVKAEGLEAPVLNQIDQLLISQAPNLVSIFVSTADVALSYFTTPHLDLSGTISPVILSREPGNFAPFVSPDESILQLAVATSDRNLSLLQQNPQSGIWTTMPFHTPSFTENIEYDAFFTSITLRGADKKILSQETFLLKCPDGWSEILLNGRSLVVGPDGVPVISDVRGKLTLITPTDDISSPRFILTDAGPSFPAHLGGAEFAIYPDQKVMDKISTIRTGDDLRKAKLPDGTNLLEQSDASNDDINQAAETIAQLRDQHDNIASGGSSRSSLARSLPNDDPRSFRVGRVRTGEDIKKMKIIGGVNAERIMAAKRIVDVDWDRVKYWWEETKTSISAAIDQIGDGIVTFVMEIGGEAVRLLIETVEQLAKAIALLVDKVIGAWENFKKWVMFLFDFDDILHTKNQIKGLMNDGLSNLGPFFKDFSDTTGSAVDGLEDQFRAALGMDEAINTSGGQNSSEEDASGQHSGISDDPGLDYVGYQMNHGGAANVTSSSARASPVSNRHLPSLNLEKAVRKTLPNLGGTGDKAAENNLLEVIKNLASSFDLTGNLTAAECGEKIASTVTSLVFDSIGGILTTTAEEMGDFFEIMRGILNTEINMPVFSALYRALTGSELTLLDAICLICAIPITSVAKILGIWDTFAVLDDLDLAELLATSGASKKRVTAKRDKDEHWQEMRKINSVFGPINCVGRAMKCIVNGLLLVFFSEEKGPGNRSLGVLVSGDFSHKQIVQFSKMVEAHPLAALAPGTGTGNGRISIKTLGLNQPDFSDLTGKTVLNGLGFALSLMNLITSWPMEPDDPKQAARRMGWFSSLASELASVGDDWEDGGKRILGRCVCTLINFVCATVVNINDIREAEEEGNDFKKGIAVTHLIEGIVDLASGVLGIAGDTSENLHLKGASVVVDLVSVVFLCVTTGLSEGHDEWNYMLCPSR